MSVGLRRLGSAAAVVALLATGCGTMAWRATPAVPGESILAAPMQPDSLAAGVKGVTGEIAGVVPSFEIIGGMSVLPLGDKSAGVDNDPPANLVAWSAMYDKGTGFDVQIVLRRPPRPAASLATGDTFMVVRGTLESYSGKAYDLDGGPVMPDGLTIYGAWLEGRTLLGGLDSRGALRPYLQYGGGVMLYGEATVSGAAHWESTMALGWRTAMGLELRKGRVGLYAEGGIQVLGPPDVAQYWIDQGIAAEIEKRVAQDMVTYPIRVGVIIGF